MADKRNFGPLLSIIQRRIREREPKTQLERSARRVDEQAPGFAGTEQARADSSFLGIGSFRDRFAALKGMTERERAALRVDTQAFPLGPPLEGQPFPESAQATADSSFLELGRFAPGGDTKVKTLAERIADLTLKGETDPKAADSLRTIQGLKQTPLRPPSASVQGREDLARARNNIRNNTATQEHFDIVRRDNEAKAREANIKAGATKKPQKDFEAQYKRDLSGRAAALKNIANIKKGTGSVVLADGTELTTNAATLSDEVKKNLITTYEKLQAVHDRGIAEFEKSDTAKQDRDSIKTLSTAFPPSQFKDRTTTDQTTGRRYISDGTQWLPIIPE